MKKSLLFTASIVAGLAAFKYFSDAGASGQTGVPPVVAVQIIAPSGEKTVAASDIALMVKTATEPELAFATFIKTLPASLVDQPTPAPLTVDAKGDLVVDGGIRFLFEHYLSALGEEPLEHIIARITYQLQAQFSDANVARGMALLESYLQYRNYLGELKNRIVSTNAGGNYDLDVIAQMKQQVKAERLRFFSDADSQALFLQEDQYDDYQLARALVSTDAALTSAQRQYKLAQIDAQAADWILISEKQANWVSEVRADEKRLIAQGADAEILFASRENAYGSEAAQRLAQVDRENQRWQERVAGYQIELQSLVASSNGNRVNADLLRALREAHFQGPEIVRIAALDGERAQ